MAPKKRQTNSVSDPFQKRRRNIRPGVIFTVSIPCKIPQATSVLIDSFNRIVDELHAQTGEQKIDSPNETVSESIINELKNLRESKKKFTSGGDICRGMAYIDFSESVEERPSEVVTRLFNSVTSASMHLPPFICKLIPCDYICGPFLDDLKSLLKDNIVVLFEKLEKSTPWTMKFQKHAMNSKIEQKNVLAYLIENIPSQHEPCVFESQLTISIDVNPQMCGVSVLENFEKFHEYNISKTRNRSDAIDALID